MSEKAKKSGKNFMVQGSILAIAGVITKIIGAVYRVPLVNILGDTGMGYYGVAFQIYAIVLTLTSYSLPLAVSKLISARVADERISKCHACVPRCVDFCICSRRYCVSDSVLRSRFYCGKYYGNEIQCHCYACIGTVCVDRCNYGCFPWILPGKWVYDPDCFFSGP